MSGDLEIATYPGKALSDVVQNELFEVFDAAYDQANHAYLVASFDVLRWISIARDNGHVVGFAIGDARKVNLPRFQKPQVVAMAGICCIRDNYRRRGLFIMLSFASMAASGELNVNQPYLFCGRMAHSASYQAMARSANNTVPAANQAISPWHREMVARLAELFRVDVDPDTCRVIGKGKPVGYPRLEYHSTEEDDQLFATVDRDNGDSLLAMSWRPEAPAGWLE